MASVVFRGLPWSSVVFRGLLSSPVVSRGLPWSPVVSRGLLWSPVLSRTLPWSPRLLDTKVQSLVAVGPSCEFWTLLATIVFMIYQNSPLAAASAKSEVCFLSLLSNICVFRNMSKHFCTSVHTYRMMRFEITIHIISTLETSIVIPVLHRLPNILLFKTGVRTHRSFVPVFMLLT